MSRIAIGILLIAGILVGWEDDTMGQPAQSPGSPPIHLTITNLPPKTAARESKAQRSIEVKGAGVLHIAFPATWQDKLARVPGKDRYFDSIMFRPQGTNDDTDFQLMVDVNNVGEAAAARVDIKNVLQQAGKMDVTNSVEQKVDIIEIKGPQVSACYFVVTDKAYDPGRHSRTDYRYLTQGYAKLEGLILSFRLVSNHLPPEQEQMLDMIKTARFEKKP